jgi:[ribosomal protein S5]-alanine N-acetyltransferase
MNYLLDGNESSRLVFRKLLPSDFDTWLEFCKQTDSLLYIWLTDKTDPIEKCKVWFDRVFYRYENNKGGMNVLINKHSGEFIGQCGLLIHTLNEVEELEIGYSIMPNQRNKGYAIEAAQKCKEFAFENNYRDSLISIIHEDNLPSEKVAIHNGMTLDFRTTYNNSPVKIYRVKKL